MVDVLANQKKKQNWYGALNITKTGKKVTGSYPVQKLPWTNLLDLPWNNRRQ